MNNQKGWKEEKKTTKQQWIEYLYLYYPRKFVLKYVSLISFSVGNNNDGISKNWEI